MEDKNDPNSESLKSKGRTAINIQHKNIAAAQEEKRLNHKISEMYGVDSDEAIDIHVNYHLDRISAFLLKRARKNGMVESMFYKRLNNLNTIGYAYRVAQGELIEMAAVDILYKQLCNLDNDDTPSDDRYINFYG
jgi:choline kinase